MSDRAAQLVAVSLWAAFSIVTVYTFVWLFVNHWPGWGLAPLLMMCCGVFVVYAAFLARHLLELRKELRQLGSSRPKPR